MVDTAVTCITQQVPQLHVLICSMFAGEHELKEKTLLLLMEAVARLALASRPLAAELFCDGVLGMLLSAAQRLLAAQPHSDREDVAVRILHGRPGDAEGRGMAHLLGAFGAAVPQARAHILPEPACRFLVSVFSNL